MRHPLTQVARAGYSLDAVNFLVAGAQTSFGAFVSVYLASNAWTQAQIGDALSLGTIVAMAGQLPAGAIVDRAWNKRLILGVGIVAVAASALLFAWPTPAPILAGQVLHGFASCLIAPAIAAISLAMAGAGAFGERLGRNARFSSIGSAIAALLFGSVGTYATGGAVFTLAGGLMLLAVLALPYLPAAAAKVPRTPTYGETLRDLRDLLSDRRLLGFAGCVALFQLANAAMLPLVAAELTLVAGSSANLIIAVCIVAPQALVAFLSPHVGRLADRIGRRPLMAIGFAAIPLRGVLLAAYINHPAVVMPVQVLDGISAAALGILLPLVAADLTGGRSGFNLRLAVLGLAGGAGATLSTSLAGHTADAWDTPAALLVLAAVGAAAVCGVLALGETRPYPAQAVTASVNT